MKRLALSPVVLAAVAFALSGCAGTQSGQSFSSAPSGRNAPSSRDRELSAASSPKMASAQCPPQRISAHKITEPEAIDLAQKYADANLKGYKVAQPTSGTGKLSKGPAYGGGYPTTCFNKDGDAFHSVEYSFEAKNVKGTSRLLSVDQFGAVREYRETASR
jgi:hypothetical protein